MGGNQGYTACSGPLQVVSRDAAVFDAHRYSCWLVSIVLSYNEKGTFRAVYLAPSSLCPLWTETTLGSFSREY